MHLDRFKQKLNITTENRELSTYDNLLKRDEMTLVGPECELLLK